MACNSHADQDDASAVRRFSDDALWICPEALLQFFDSETQGSWRLTDCEPEMAILHRCPALQRVKLLGAPKGLALTGFPLSLRGIEIWIRSDSDSSDDPGDSADSGSADSDSAADSADSGAAADSTDSDAAGGRADSAAAAAAADSDVPEVGELTDLHLSPALHRSTELSQLQEAALHGFPYTRLPTLDAD
eukprot:gene28942-biopygen32819